MDELQRLELRKEIKSYLEEERREEEKEKMVELEKEFKILTYIVGVSSFVTGIILTVLSDEKLFYLLHFLLFFGGACLVMSLLKKSKINPKDKSMLLLFPMLICILGIVASFVLIKEGII